MNKRFEKLVAEAFFDETADASDTKIYKLNNAQMQKFAQLIVAECISKIELYEIPVGNSAAGEMACEWTQAALKQIRAEIRELFGVEQ